LFLFIFIAGLSLTNHHEMAIVLFVYALFGLYYVIKEKVNFKMNSKYIVLIVCLFALGVSLYMYLPIRSFADPVIDWGNPDTFERLQIML